MTFRVVNDLLKSEIWFIIIIILFTTIEIVLKDVKKFQ